jgi:hypothetical protein
VSGNKRLQKRIDTRKAFIKQVFAFVDKLLVLLAKHVRTPGKDEQDTHTHLVRHLTGFRNFSFKLEMGIGKLNGASVTIWYHPITPEAIGLPVLHATLSSNTPTEVLEVQSFQPHPDWQARIRYFMRNPEEVAASFVLAREQVKGVKKLEESPKIRALREERQKLLDEARRLRLL